MAMTVSIPLPTLATGSHFYKYSTTKHLDRLKIILLEHELFFPELSQMKDLSDGKPRFAPLTREQLCDVLSKAHIKNHQVVSRDGRDRVVTKFREWLQHQDPEEVLRKLAEGVYQRSRDRHRVLCLTKRWDNSYMWENYADDSSGYCLEFAKGPFFATACEVTYGDGPPIMDITDPEDRGPFTFYKKREYSGEEEVRITLMPGSGPIEKIEPRSLTRIILGEKMLDADRKQILEWCKQRDPELAVDEAYFDQLHQTIKARSIS